MDPIILMTRPFSYMDFGRFSRGNQSQTRDKLEAGTLAERCAAAAADLAPKTDLGVAGFQTASHHRAAQDNDELERLRADDRNKNGQIAALKSEMRIREDQLKAELDTKMAAAHQRAEQEKAEMREDIEVLRSLQNNLWAENRILKARNREQKKALPDYHVLYSLQKAYDTHHSELVWYKQRAAERLHDKYKRADGDAIKAAYELYKYLEDNGLDDTLKLDPDLKKSLKWMEGEEERPL